MGGKIDTTLHRLWIVAAFTPVLILGVLTYVIAAPMFAFDALLKGAKRAWNQ